jgi:hypothetical protein
MVFGIAIIDNRFKHHRLLLSKLSAMHAPNQFLSLATEHASTDNFNPSSLLTYYIHSSLQRVIYRRAAFYVNGFISLLNG